MVLASRRCHEKVYMTCLCDVARDSFSMYDCGAFFLKTLNLFSSLLLFTGDCGFFFFLGGLPGSLATVPSSSSIGFLDLGFLGEGCVAGVEGAWWCSRTTEGCPWYGCTSLFLLTEVCPGNATLLEDGNGEGVLSFLAPSFVVPSDGYSVTDFAKVLDLVAM